MNDRSVFSSLDSMNRRSFIKTAAAAAIRHGGVST
ncbi:twin-arginine translocation signal domain-containing protein [Mesorhizobium sp. WSM3868]|nr:twin-arginine translocation signal domain-containing protein [Mesorhizobium sp. WSM3868]